MMMQVINLTPHAVVIVVGEEALTIPPSGTVAQVQSTTEVVQHIGPIPVSRQSFGLLFGLPEPTPETWYVVSDVIARRAAQAGRTDVVAPDMAHAVRDSHGHIVGVPGFVQF
jgi:hypothetical protein